MHLDWVVRAAILEFEFREFMKQTFPRKKGARIHIVDVLPVDRSSFIFRTKIKPTLTNNRPAVLVLT